MPTYVPLLQLQRDLYRLPLGTERFRKYIQTMVDAETGDLELPLVAMNPMAKDHVPAFLDSLLACDADGVGARATAEAARSLGGRMGNYRTCLVASDDLKGGWTNRWAAEHSYRFGQRPLYRRCWIACLLWTSDRYTPERIREEVLQCFFRAAYVEAHGEAETLDELMAQEGHAMHMAGSLEPALEPADMAYTEEVLAPYRGLKDHPTVMASLFGDEAARQLGHRPLGLSLRAGLALALHEARAKRF